MKLALLPLLLLPLLAQADSQRLPYTCDNGSRIDLSFSTAGDGRPLATLHFADTAIVLPQVPAASGAAYKQDGIALHTKDDAAIFEDGKGNLRRCARADSPPVTPDNSMASSFIELTGSVSYLTRQALPPEATLVLRAQDRRGRTLAEQSIALAGQQVPIVFQMTVDRDLLGKQPRLLVSARIEQAGGRLFNAGKAYAALDHGQASPLHITLKPASRKQ